MGKLQTEISRFETVSENLKQYQNSDAEYLKGQKEVQRTYLQENRNVSEQWTCQ